MCASLKQKRFWVGNRGLKYIINSRSDTNFSKTWEFDSINSLEIGITNMAPNQRKHMRPYLSVDGKSDNELINSWYFSFYI